MTNKHQNWWWVSTPYVDAYEHAEWVTVDHVPIIFEEFKKKMYLQASTWGEAGLGCAVIRGEDIPKDHNGSPVLAIGTWDDKSWAIIPTPGTKWYEGENTLIKFTWPKEWNVT